MHAPTAAPFKLAPNDVLSKRRIVRARRKFPCSTLLGSHSTVTDLSCSQKDSQEGEIATHELCHAKRFRAQTERISEVVLDMSVAEKNYEKIQDFGSDVGRSGLNAAVKSYFCTMLGNAICHNPGTSHRQLGNISKLPNQSSFPDGACAMNPLQILITPMRVHPSGLNIFWEAYPEQERLFWNALPSIWLKQIPDWLLRVWVQLRASTDSGKDRSTDGDKISHQVTEAFTLARKETNRLYERMLKGADLNVDPSVRLFLYHCLRTRDKTMIEYFAQAPGWMTRLAPLPNITGKQNQLDPLWLIFFLDHGGLQVAIDLDQEHHVKTFRSILSSVMKYTHQLKSFKLPTEYLSSHIQQHFFNGVASPFIQTVQGGRSILRSSSDIWARFLSIMVSIPEYSSQERIMCALDTIRVLKRLPEDQKAQVFCEAVDCFGPLELALRTCRAAVIAAMLDCVPHLLAKAVTSRGPPLHCFVRIVAETSGSFSSESTFDLGMLPNAERRNKPKEFSIGLLNWHILCMGVRGNASSRTVCLRLKNPEELRDDLKVLVNVKIHIKSDDVRELDLIFSQSDPYSDFEILPIAQKVRFSFKTRFVSTSARRIRDQDERNFEMLQIVNDLIQHGADVNHVHEGHTPWSLTQSSSVPIELQALLMPTNVGDSLKRALNRKILNWMELESLMKVCSPDLKLDGLNLIRLIGENEAINHGPSSPSALDFLKFFLECGVTPVKWCRAVTCAVEQRDWASLKILIPYAPGGVCLENIRLHNLVQSGQIPLLREILKYVADVNVVSNSPPYESATALHVAAGKGDLEAVIMLLEKRADCNLKQRGSQFTALHEACNNAKDGNEHHEKVVSILLQHGADPKSWTSRRQEPSHLTKSRVIRALLSTAQNKQLLSKSESKMSAGNHCSRRNQKSAAPVLSPQGGPSNMKKASDLSCCQTFADKIRRDHRTDYNQRIACIISKIENLSSRSVLPPNEGCGITILSAGEETSEGLTPSRIQNLQSFQAEQETGSQVHHVPDAIALSNTATNIMSPDVCSLTVAAGPNKVAVPPMSCLLDTEWDLRFTREFKEQLFALHSQPVLLKSMVENLRALACGDQGRHLLKNLKGTPKALRIFESPCKTFADGARFLWQYAVDYSPRVRSFTDTIRLWRICLNHDDVSTAIDFIVSSHKRGRTSSLRKHLKPISKDSCVRDGRRFPRTYEAADAALLESVDSQDMLQFESLTPSDLDIEDNDEVVLYTPPAIAAADSFNVLKFYALNEDVFRSILSTIDCPSKLGSLELPFIPDESEDRLISADLEKRTSSILLVGRSGTGKTSIAVGRMWALYRQWHSTFSSPVDIEGVCTHYHQVFVTANKVLRDQVRKSFNGMKLGFCMGHEDGSVPEYPPSFREVKESMFPLFLTQSEWLRMLDGTLEHPFFPRNEDGTVRISTEGGFHEEIGMLDEIPNDDDWFSEDEMGADFQHRSDDRGASSVDEIPADQVKKARLEIDFPMFQSRIWPKLVASRKGITKQLSPSSLFQEIHSYIKGSHLALSKKNGRLSQDEYLHLPVKMAPNFCGLGTNETMEDLPADKRGHRYLIYDLFLEYEAEKNRMDAYDISDVVFYIWTQLKQTPYGGVPLHSIFVDEVQDFTQAELKLFLHVCSDKNDLFFSGDTCQTIASGVGFRFEDLKCLFKDEQDLMFHKYGSKSTLTITVPQVTALTVNYRTHSGILSTAAKVVDLLEAFFPSSIDFLPRERGFFQGPKPTLVTETKVDVATILIVGSDKKSSQIEFGAHQVILVRNQMAKQSLPSEFDGCLAMTVLESKGLEFDDVFLWNFFTDSKADKEWRLVLSFICRGDNAEEFDALEKERSACSKTDVSGMLRTLRFDPNIHQILCEELKHFYTAITRARVRVVIFDQDERKRAPMFYYLKRQSLVQTLSVLLADAHTSMTVQTKPEEWRSRGLNLRETGMHKLAAMCFKHSGDKELESESLGEYMATKKSIELQGTERKECFFDAGEHFLAANKLIKAARCFYEAAEFEIAGRLFMTCSATEAKHDSEQDQLAHHAFSCYRKAGKLKDAVEILVVRGRVKSALKILKDEREYEAAIVVLEGNKSYQPNPELSFDCFLKLAAAAHPAVKLLAKGGSFEDDCVQAFLKLLAKMQPEDELNHLKKYPQLTSELIQRLLKLDRFSEAASILEGQNRILEGAKVLDSMPSPSRTDILLSADLYTRYAFAKDCENPKEYLLMAQRALEKLSKTKNVTSQGVSPCESEMMQTDKLQMLQIRLEIALRTDNKDSRTEILEEVYNSSLATGCRVCSAYALYELQQAKELDFDCKQTETKDSRLRAISHVIKVLNTLLRALKDEHTAAGADLRISEQFFGLSRVGGTLCISKTRKPILDTLLDVGAGIPKGFSVVIEISRFKAALVTNLASKRLRLVLRFHSMLQKVRIDSDARCISKAEQLKESLLMVWVTDLGIRYLKAKGLEKITRAESDSMRAIFCASKLESACQCAEADMCHTLQSETVAQVEEALPSRGSWSEERQGALMAMACYARSLYDTHCGNMTPRMLSRVLQIFDCIDFRKDAVHVVCDLCKRQAASMSAISGNGSAIKPESDINNVGLGQSGLGQSVQSLGSALSARRRREFIQEALHNMRYLGCHASCPDPPANAWHMIRMAVVEALAVLAMPHLRRSWAQAAKRVAEKPFAILLPQSLANRLMGVRRAPSPPGDALNALLQALAIARVLNAAQEVTDVQSAAVREEECKCWYPILVRASMFNFFVSIDPVRSDEAGWMDINAAGSLLSAAVEASLLPTLLSTKDCPCAFREGLPTLSIEAQEKKLIEPLTAWGARLIAVHAVRNGGEFSFASKPADVDFSVFHAAAVRGARRAISLLETSPAPLPTPAHSASSEFGSAQPQMANPNSLEHSSPSSTVISPNIDSACSNYKDNGTACQISDAAVAGADDDDGIEAEHKKDRRLAGVIARFLRHCVFRSSLRRLLRISRTQAFPFFATTDNAGDCDSGRSNDHGNGLLDVGIPVEMKEFEELQQQRDGGSCPTTFAMPWAGGGYSATAGCWAADPFGRFLRYSMYEERVTAASAIGRPRRELWNLDSGMPVMDDSGDANLYCQTVAALSRFAVLYRQHVLPVLAGLDHAQLRLQALVGFFRWAIAGGLLLSPENAVALDNCIAQVGVAERDLVALLDAADAAGWRSPAGIGEIEHAPLISLVTAVEQQVLLPVMTALRAIETEATAAAAAQVAAVQDAALLQQQASIIRSGFATSGTALYGNRNFSGGTCSTFPSTPSEQQQHCINAEIQMGTGRLSACAGPFLPAPTSVNSALTSVISGWNENGQSLPGPLEAGGLEQPVLDASSMLFGEDDREDLQQGAKTKSGRVPLSTAAAGGGGGGRGRQARPPQPHHTGSAKGVCSKGDERQSVGDINSFGSGGSCGSGRTGDGSCANGDTGAGRGGRIGGCGRRTTEGRDGGGRRAGGGGATSSSSSTAARGGDLGRGSRVVASSRVGCGAGGSTLPAASAQEAGPGWQQAAPGPATRKCRRFGSKRKPFAAAAAPATTARSTPS